MLKNTLEKGLLALNIKFTGKQIDLLLAYVNLLTKWNKSFNLTAIRNPQEMIPLHILDSLSILPFIDGENILDVGTGPGLPGIPLAIFCPDKKFTLLDSNGKKTRFLQQVRHQLSIKNIEVIQERVEECQPKVLFDNITSRAFSDLHKFIKLTKHLIKPNGKFLAMKGAAAEDETQKISLPFEIKKLNIPGLNKSRQLVIVSCNETIRI